ncbi:hypothetical protein NQ227_25225, partial [Escherichia coli]|nr:hypothetical protein [Escherichia coli]
RQGKAAPRPDQVVLICVYAQSRRRPPLRGANTPAKLARKLCATFKRSFILSINGPSTNEA